MILTAQKRERSVDRGRAVNIICPTKAFSTMSYNIFVSKLEHRCQDGEMSKQVKNQIIRLEEQW